jgi:hypothetical protein
MELNRTTAAFVPGLLGISHQGPPGNNRTGGIRNRRKEEGILPRHGHDSYHGYYSSMQPQMLESMPTQPYSLVFVVVPLAIPALE